MGKMTDVIDITVPKENKMPKSENNVLKIFEPITFPSAISFSPRFAAIQLVKSSGSDVPTATTVSPTKTVAFDLSAPAVVASLIARYSALFEIITPPSTIPTSPTIRNIII